MSKVTIIIGGHEMIYKVKQAKGLQRTVTYHVSGSSSRLAPFRETGHPNLQSVGLRDPAIC